MNWIDAESGGYLGKLFNDTDLSDTKTRYVYANFVGNGPVNLLAEEYGGATLITNIVGYSEDKLQTAVLSPVQFRQFVGAYSVQLLFGKAEQGFWYRFWNIF